MSTKRKGTRELGEMEDPFEAIIDRDNELKKELDKEEDYLKKKNDEKGVDQRLKEKMTKAALRSAASYLKRL